MKIKASIEKSQHWNKNLSPQENLPHLLSKKTGPTRANNPLMSSPQEPNQ